VAAWLGTRKVRHLGVLQVDGMWVPLCARPYQRLPESMWLGPTDHSEYISDGNQRRAYRARLAHPVCNRCLREVERMQKLLAAELVSLYVQAAHAATDEAGQ
jgi:hypothetical protein